MKTETNTHCIDVCNSLLRGELSAVETYNQALEKFASAPETETLAKFRDEHLESARELSANVASMGGAPSTETGAWGLFATGVQGAANLLGENSAISSLNQGEKHGRDEYTDALQDDEVLATCKDLIRGELLPRVERHIKVLEHFS